MTPEMQKLIDEETKAFNQPIDGRDGEEEEKVDLKMLQASPETILEAITDQLKDEVEFMNKEAHHDQEYAHSLSQVQRNEAN